jgi:hypothetical protein
MYQEKSGNPVAKEDVPCMTGLPDGFFQTKNPNLDKFRGAVDCKMLIYFVAIWNILRTFGTFCVDLVHFVLIWYILC